MIRGLYNWTLALAEHPRALWALAVVSFVESSFFPIPPDLIMIPMIIATPRKAWLIALVCTVSSVLGGIFGYFIGAVLFETIGQPIFDFYGKSDAVAEFNATFNEYGAMAVFVAGVTFIHFKVVTILSGATGLSLPIFIVASIAARALRFFIVAALLWKFGAPIRVFIEKYLGILFVLFVILLFGGIYLVRFL